MSGQFYDRLAALEKKHELLLHRSNLKAEAGNGIFDRYQHPILTAQHTPLFWRYDLNAASNPFLMERFGINAVLNAGAIKWNGKYLLIVRVEASNRKSFFAVAESPNGIDHFRFWDYPVNMPAGTLRPLPVALKRCQQRLGRAEAGPLAVVLHRHDSHAPGRQNLERSLGLGMIE